MEFVYKWYATAFPDMTKAKEILAVLHALPLAPALTVAPLPLRNRALHFNLWFCSTLVKLPIVVYSFTYTFILVLWVVTECNNELWSWQ